MIVQRTLSAASTPGAQQFVKFCIVGASSTVIDFGIFNLLHFALKQPLLVAISCGFLGGVTNGFYWNRRWTFKDGAADVRKQYPKFFATNLIGYCLNVSIMTLALYVGAKLGFLHTEATLRRTVELMVLGKGKEVFSPVAANTAKAIATVCVTAWNFTASKFWTFKAK